MFEEAESEKEEKDEKQESEDQILDSNEFEKT